MKQSSYDSFHQAGKLRKQLQVKVHTIPIQMYSQSRIWAWVLITNILASFRLNGRRLAIIYLNFQPHYCHSGKNTVLICDPMRGICSCMCMYPPKGFTYHYVALMRPRAYANLSCKYVAWFVAAYLIDHKCKHVLFYAVFSWLWVLVTMIIQCCQVLEIKHGQYILIYQNNTINRIFIY